MSDDLDALLARADDLTLYLAAAYNGISFYPTLDDQRQTARESSRLVKDLAAALRESRADYRAALDVIARLTEGWEPEALVGGGSAWFRDQKEPPEDMSDREWRVYCEATRSRT